MSTSKIAKFLLLGLLISFTELASAASINGNNWLELPDDMRTAFVAGMFQGVNLGNSLESMTCYEGDTPEAQKNSCSVLLQETGNAAITKYLKTKTVGQIAAGINEFYRDYRNRALPLSEAAFIVIRRINGDPNIDTYVLNIRKQY